MEAAWAANRGRQHTEQTRQRMSETHRQRGTMPPGTRPWTTEEDELVRQAPASEAASRTLGAVYARRSLLGVNDGRTARWQGQD